MANANKIVNLHIVEELNKQREVQKELLARRGYLLEYINISQKDYDANEVRLSEINNKIQQLRSKLC